MFTIQGFEDPLSSYHLSKRFNMLKVIAVLDKKNNYNVFFASISASY